MEKTPLDKHQVQLLKTAQKSTDELGLLIENFFEYSYLVTAKTEPNLKKININNYTILNIAKNSYNLNDICISSNKFEFDFVSKSDKFSMFNAATKHDGVILVPLF